MWGAGVNSVVSHDLILLSVAELFVPVLNDADTQQGRLFCSFDHDEALAI